MSVSSIDATAIRRAVAAARRAFPTVDVDNVGEIAIRAGASVGITKVILFDLIAAASPPAGVITFRRVPLSAVLGADRRAL